MSKKMTDLEKFIDCYKQFGIEVKTKKTKSGTIAVILSHDQADCTESEKFTGYIGFYSDLEFTAEGKFIKQGFWE